MRITQALMGILIPMAMVAPAWGQTLGTIGTAEEMINIDAQVIDVSQIQSGGTGCKSGGAGPSGGRPLEVYQSNFSGRVMIFLPEMSVDVTQKGIDRKACAISLPVSLPAGKRLVLGQPAVFGSADLSEGASAIAMTEVFEAGSQGPKIETKLTAAEASDETYYYDRSEDEIRTACGAQLNLRANISLLGQKGSSAGGTATLEGAAMTLHVEDCP